MHRSSYDKMAKFCRDYLEPQKGKPLTIVDLGSADYNGSYRPLFAHPPWHYIGVDLEPGENVNLILRDPYDWREFKSESVDVLISGQTFEHTEFFWETALEIARILRPSGLCCIIAPASGPEHRFPRDCWRIFSDGFSAVARYAGLEVVEARTQWEDLPDYDSESNKWHESILIARKPVLPLGAKLRWSAYTYVKRLLRPSAPTPETIIQIFYSSDGGHSEANSICARIGRDGWKEVSLALPRNAGAAPLRIDFMSNMTTIDVASIRLVKAGSTYFSAPEETGFDSIVLSGDVERLAHPTALRLKITGVDPQLYLPVVALPSSEEPLVLQMRLRVSAMTASLE